MNKELKNVLKNLGWATLSLPMSGLLVFILAGLIAIVNEALNVIEKPFGFKIYFVVGFILAFIYFQYKSKRIK